MSCSCLHISFLPHIHQLTAKDKLVTLCSYMVPSKATTSVAVKCGTGSHTNQTWMPVACSLHLAAFEAKVRSRTCVDTSSPSQTGRMLGAHAQKCQRTLRKPKVLRPLGGNEPSSWPGFCFQLLAESAHSAPSKICRLWTCCSIQL